MHACTCNYMMCICQGLSAHIVTGSGGKGEGRREGGDKLQLCQDLTETTLDMLARYTYSNISSLPSRYIHVCVIIHSTLCMSGVMSLVVRSSGADFLVSGGPSKTWVLSNYLVTVTTTGEAGGKPGRCARCMVEFKSSGSRSHVPSVATTREDNTLCDMPNAAGGSALCSCWCWGWTEVKVRRPSGNTAWMLRLQNRLQGEHILSRREGELAAVAAAYNYPFEAEESVIEDQQEHLQQDREGGQLEERVVGGPGGQLEEGVVGEQGGQLEKRVVGEQGGQLEERVVGEQGGQLEKRVVGEQGGELVEGGHSVVKVNGGDQLSWQQTPIPWQPVAEEGGAQENDRDGITLAVQRPLVK